MKWCGAIDVQSEGSGYVVPKEWGVRSGLNYINKIWCQLLESLPADFRISSLIAPLNATHSSTLSMWVTVTRESLPRSSHNLACQHQDMLQVLPTDQEDHVFNLQVKWRVTWVKLNGQYIHARWQTYNTCKIWWSSNQRIAKSMITTNRVQTSIKETKFLSSSFPLLRWQISFTSSWT